MLWFIQHYLWDLGRHPDIGAEEMDAWHNGYLVGERAVRQGRRRRGAPGARRAPAPRPGRRRGRRAGAAARLPALLRRAARPRRLPGRLPAPVHPHPLAAERLLARAARAHPRGRVPRACSATTSSPSTRATTRATSCTAATTCSTSRSTRRAASVRLRRPRGVGARLPGVHRPGVAARRRRLAPGAHRRAQAARQAARVPAGARRPPRPQQEHHPRLRRARPLPRAAPRVQGALHLPRPAAALTRGRRGVRHLPRARGARRSPTSTRGTAPPTGCPSTCASRTTSR